MSHDAGGRTNTKRERKYFLVFLKMSVTQCGRPDRHNERELFYFLYILFFIIFKYIFFYFFFVIFLIFKHFVFFLKKIKKNKIKDKT